MATEGVPAGTRFVWDQAEKRLEAQIRQAEGLDTKAGALVALHALGAGLVATVAGRFHGDARLIVVGTIAGLLVSGSFALAAFRIEAFDRRPAPEAMWRFGEWREEEIRFRFLSTRFDALAENRRVLDRKARHIAWSLSVLSVVVLAVAIAAIVAIVRAQ